MNAIFPPRPPICIPIRGQAALFPVRRIYCVGRNYAAHVREMGGDPSREKPFFFAKDADAVLQNGGTLPYPPATHDLHHEIELVVAIGEQGFQLTEQAASALIFGYAVGLDMTRRDLQSEARAQGRPWTTAKNFPGSAPVSAIHPVSQTGLLASGTIALRVNGALRQQGQLQDMVWNVAETLQALSRLYRLMPGDLVFTGTPEGVGAVREGDVLSGSIDGLETLTITIGAPA